MPKEFTFNICVDDYNMAMNNSKKYVDISVI